MGLVEVAFKGLPRYRILSHQLHSFVRLHSDLPILLLLKHSRGLLAIFFILATKLKGQVSAALFASLAYAFVNGTAVIISDIGVRGRRVVICLASLMIIAGH